MNTTRRLALQARSAFPGGPWGRMLVLVTLLLAGTQAIGAASMRQGLLDPKRIAAYERRGYDVDAQPGSADRPATLVVSRARDGEVLRRPIGQDLLPGPALALVLRPATAALLAFVLLQLLAWFSAGRPIDRTLVRWDRSLPVLWLVPVGLSILLLSRLALDVPAASPSRFPSALDWASRQSQAAVLAALLIPLSAGVALLMERRGWFQGWMQRPIVGPIRRYDSLLAAAVGLFAVVGALGRSSFGATVSLGIGGSSVQVVEGAKLLLVLHAAYMLADLDRAEAWPRTVDPRRWTPTVARLLTTGAGAGAGGDCQRHWDAGTAPCRA